MRLFKKHTDALSSRLDSETVSDIKNTVGDDPVRGWSVFDADGIEIVSEGVSETTIAVCSNAIDLATKIGSELNETDPSPSITFMKGSREMQVTSLANTNLIIFRDHAGGHRKETRHGH